MSGRVGACRPRRPARGPRAVLALALALACSGIAGAPAAELSEEQELAMSFGDRSFVSVATGSRVALARAPAVATVVTAEQIRASGAFDLDDVLGTVPGLHVSRSHVADAPLYLFRGIRGALSNPQVLMLVNGVPMTTAYTGDRGLQWGGLPVENIARIEIIRGPGSALHGADAYAGVISIVTKSAADIAGSQTGAWVGSRHGRRLWWLHGARHHGVDVAAHLSAGQTDGSGRIIDADAQTQLDRVFGAFGVAPVSLAPGPIRNGYRLLDASVEAGRGHWRARASLKRVSDQSSGAGVAQALDRDGHSLSQRTDAELLWQAPAFAGAWELSARAHAAHYEEHSQLVLFPPGANLGHGAFRDGMIGNPEKWERRHRVEATAVHTAAPAHRVRLGAGYALLDLYRVRETKNFNPDFSPIGSGSLADVIDVTGTVPFVEPHRRQVWHVFAQDEWALAPDWNLTAGVRHDRYSDFGGTTHPRLALVWNASYDTTVKLLYGSAYRAPAFSELYAINNPAVVGNPRLAPERVRTWEAAASWQPGPGVRGGLNVFHYRTRGVIVQDPARVYQNQGAQAGHGLEAELAWEPGRTWQLAGHYSIVRATDRQTGRDPGRVPRHRAHLQLDWRPVPGWQTQARLLRVAGRQREAADTRAPIPNYTTLDLTVQTAAHGGAWDFALVLRNLFDADVREPSAWGVPFVALPNDLPQPGRSLQLRVSRRL